MKPGIVCLLVAIMLVVLSSGCGSRTPAELLAGTWEMVGPGTQIVFMEDGTWIFASEEETGTWTVTDGNPPVLTIYDSEGHMEGDTEVIFDGDDSFSMNIEGQAIVMNRVE